MSLPKNSLVRSQSALISAFGFRVAVSVLVNCSEVIQSHGHIGGLATDSFFQNGNRPPLIPNPRCAGVLGNTPSRTLRGVFSQPVISRNTPYSCFRARYRDAFHCEAIAGFCRLVLHLPG